MPAYPRKRTFDEMDEDGPDSGRHAAGVLFVSPEGRVLLLKRSGSEDNYGGYWALPGGGMEAGETPEDTARRESAEEIGVEPERLRQIDRRRTPRGLTFHTFAAPSEEFEPRLNGEHTDHAWADLDDLPEPVHPAVLRTLRERLGGSFEDDPTARDMRPEDWRGLRDGFARWTREEQAEPEHAADDFEEGKHKRDEDGRFASGGAFHGTNEKFEKFDSTKIGQRDPGHLGRGFYFSTDPNIARTNKYRIEAALHIKKPLNISIPDFKTDKRDVVRKALGLDPGVSPEKINEALRRKGHDAVILDYGPTGYHHQEIMVPESDQISIKSTSAIGSAHDDAEGKLDQTEKSEADKNHGEREEQPADVFLDPGSRKYPVKTKRDGEWKWSRDLLLAAARRARMNGNESLAKRADAIRDREFGQGADAYDAIALDEASVREPDRDGRMRVRKAHISKAGVNPYRGDEIPGWQELGLEPDKVYAMLRPPEELRKAADTFNGIQLLRDHVPVDAEDHRPHDVVGATGTEAEFNDPYLDNSLHVWTRDAIDGIEDDSKRQLSCGYHYRAEMTPGEFRGTRYDGVMRDICGNHVALVEQGRAGPDVIVGDSALPNQESSMSKPTRFANLALQLTSAYVKPLLAKDAKIDLGPAFTGLTRKNFDPKKLMPALDKALKGKLAKDADMGQIAELLDHVKEGAGEGADESVSEPQHKAMEAAAHGESKIGIPEKVGKEFVSKDEEKINGLRSFLKEKGLGEDDIMKACDMMGTAEDPALDEDDAEKRDNESEGERLRERERRERGEDRGMDKKAMDAAIKVSVEGAVKTARSEFAKTAQEMRAAEAKVRPYIGELPLTMTFDSAESIYRHALKTLGVDGADKVHASALETILGYQQKPGDHRVERREPSLGMDEAATKSLDERFGTGRIGAA